MSALARGLVAMIAIVAFVIPRLSPAAAASGNLLFVKNADIFSLVDGVTTNLTDSAEVEIAAEWSPDGTEILFDRIDFAAQEDSDIWIADADGSNPRPLVAGPNKEQDPSWSPDGSQFAFAREDPDGAHIYTANADGSSIQQITRGSVIDFAPEWSPDGSRIAFTRMAVDGESRSVVVYELATGDMTQLTPTEADADASYPTWSPDGNTIAFQKLVGLYHRIVLIEADGSNERVVGGIGRDYPVWSPDGSQIAFMKMHRLGHSQGVFVMGLSGKVLEQLAPVGTPLDWRP